MKAFQEAFAREAESLEREVARAILTPGSWSAPAPTEDEITAMVAAMRRAEAERTRFYELERANPNPCATEGQACR